MKKFLLLTIAMVFAALNINAKVNFTSNPADGSTVESIKRVVLTFPDAQTADMSQAMIPGSCKNAAGETVCAGILTWADDWNQLTWEAGNKVTDDGTYTITIPAGYVILDNAPTTEDIVFTLKIGDVKTETAKVEFSLPYRKNTAGVVKSVIHSGNQTITGWPTGMFEANVGQLMTITLDEQAYQVDSVLINGVKTEGVKGVYEYMVKDYTGVEIFALPILNVAVDNADKVKIINENREEVTLAAGEQYLPAGNYIIQPKLAGYVLKSVKINGKEQKAMGGGTYYMISLNSGDKLEINADYAQTTAKAIIQFPYMENIKPIVTSVQHSGGQTIEGYPQGLFDVTCGYKLTVNLDATNYNVDSVYVNGVKTAVQNGAVTTTVTGYTDIEVCAVERDLFTINVDNAGKVKFLNENRQEVTLYNGSNKLDAGTYLIQAKTSGYTINKVLLNGVELKAPYGYYQVELAKGDNLEIYADYEVATSKVEFSLPYRKNVGEVVKSVSHSGGATIEGWPTGMFEATNGYKMIIALDETNYQVDSVLVNGVKLNGSYGNYTIKNITEYTAVEIFAYKKELAVINIDDANKVKMIDENYKEQTLISGTQKLNAGNYMVQSKVAGYTLNKVVLNGEELKAPYGYYQVSLADEDTLDITAAYTPVNSKVEFSLPYRKNVGEVVKTVTHSGGATIEGWPTGDFAAANGYKMTITLDEDNYQVDSVLVNNVKLNGSYGVYTIKNITEYTAVEIFAYKKELAVINIDNANKVKMTDANGKELTLYTGSQKFNAASYTVESKTAGYTLNKVALNGLELTATDGAYNVTLADKDTLDITADYTPAGSKVEFSLPYRKNTADVVKTVAHSGGATIEGWPTGMFEATNGYQMTITLDEENYQVDSVLVNNEKVAGVEGVYSALIKEYTSVEIFALEKSAYATLEPGDYMIQNVSTGKYFGGANSWGTQASLVDNGRCFTLAQLEDGTYTLDSHAYNNASSHFLNNGWTDGASTPVEIYEVEGGYTLSQTSGYYTAPAEGTVLTQDAEASEASIWKLISLADATAALTAGSDATFLIKDASVSRNLYNASYEAAWEGSPKMGGDNTNQNMEKWNAGTFDINQTLTNIPNGVYTLTMQGYYRQGNTGTAETADAYENGTEISPVLYANNDSIAIKSVFSEAKTESDGGWVSECASTAGTTYYIPNSQSNATTIFNTGAYVNTLDVTVTDGTLKIGVARTGDACYDWTVMDNFTLTYKGEKTVDIAGQWYEQTTGMYYGNDWEDFSLTNNPVTVDVDGTTATFTGLLGEKDNVFTATIDASAKTLTFAKGQTAYFYGYDWELGAEDETGAQSDLVGHITEDGSITLDGLNVFYSGWSYMYNTKITLGRVQVEEPEQPEVDDTYAGAWYLQNVETDLYATYGIGYWTTECNLNSTATQVNISAVEGGYILQFEGQSKWIGQNSWDAQCYADGPKTVYTINPAEDGLTYIIKKADNGQYLTYAYDNDYSINNIIWGDTEASWRLLTKEQYELAQRTFAVSTDSYTGSFYEGTVVEAPLDEILAKIGAASISDVTIYSEEPDGTRTSSVRGNTDGWRAADGTFTTWGDAAYFYVQDNTEMPGAEYYVGGYPGKTDEPCSFTAKLVYVNNATTAEAYLNVTLNYVEAPKAELTFSDLDISASVSYSPEEGSYTEKVVSLSDEQIAAICNELGIASLAEDYVYGYNPTTKEVLTSYSNYDGWRDVNGDFANWKGNSDVPYCVKVYNDGADYYCYNIEGCTTTADCYWAIANQATMKAVLVKITFTYTESSAANNTTGINDVTVDSQKTIYNVVGQKMQKMQRGINIVNGKKILVK